MKPMRAKVTITSVEKPYEGAERVSMMPVVSGEQFGPKGESENNTYARYTPTGAISLTITNPDLHGVYAAGQQFYVDFTPAEQ